MARLFCFGTGYTASALIARLAQEGGWGFTGTVRDAVKRRNMAGEGLETRVWDATAPLPRAAFAETTHVLLSVPPGPGGDPVLRHHRAELADLAPRLAWVGYLSTTGVYGDHGGAWVDEVTPPNPTTRRGRRRLAAEQGWLRLFEAKGLPVHIFRLAGIYGPGRNALLQVLAGKARRIAKEKQVFSRIHVDDLVAVLAASIARPCPGAVYNVCDDEPAPQADVVAFACGLLGREPPPLEPFETAAATLPPMALSFYEESRRCSNARIKADLGVTLRYPTYRKGLRALLTGARER